MDESNFIMKKRESNKWKKRGAIKDIYNTWGHTEINNENKSYKKKFLNILYSNK